MDCPLLCIVPLCCFTSHAAIDNLPPLSSTAPPRSIAALPHVPSPPPRSQAFFLSSKSTKPAHHTHSNHAFLCHAPPRPPHCLASPRPLHLRRRGEYGRREQPVLDGGLPLGQSHGRVFGGVCWYRFYGTQHSQAEAGRVALSNQEGGGRSGTKKLCADK